MQGKQQLSSALSGSPGSACVQLPSLLAGQPSLLLLSSQ
jgi:hypothetical protein